MRTSLMLFLVFVIVAAAPVDRAAAQVTSSSDFIALSVDGDPIAGRLRSLDSGWRITIEGDERTELRGGDLVSLRRKDFAPVPGPSGGQILLAGGDRLRAVARRATQDSLLAYSELLGNLEIPLERVVGVLMTAPAETPERERLCRRIAAATRKQDVITLANGDELSGSLLGFDDMTIRLDGAKEPVTINRQGVRVVAMSSELISAPRPKELHAELVLADGSSLTVLDAKLESPSVRARLPWGRDLSVPFEQIAAIEFRNGRVAYLSDREPDEFEHTAFLNVPFKLARDSSVLGNAISLRGQLFRKGLGTHSRSEVSYKLGESFRRFEAVVGVDDETGGGGSVRCRVLVDGRVAWESNVLTGRSAPQPVSVPLDGAKRLTLVVDFADRGDVQDHADWADARLVR